MTIKISQLGNLTAVLGNVIIPVVANVAGTLTTVKGNVTQLKDFIIGGSQTYGNVVPSANVTYNLGSPTAQWKDLYLSGTTIYLGGATMSYDGSAVLFDQPLAPFSLQVTGPSTFEGIDINQPSWGITGTGTAALYVGDPGSLWGEGALVVETNNLDGNGIVPSNADMYSLGTTDFPWSAVYTGNLIFTDLSEQTTAFSQYFVDEIGNILGNVANAQVDISTLQSDITALEANAAVQAGQIAAVAANVSASSYGNSNVASYISSYTGNITTNVLTANAVSTKSLTISSEYTLPATDGNIGYVLTTDGAGGVTWEDPFSQTEFDNLIITYIPNYPGNANSFVSTPSRLEAREYVTAPAIVGPNVFAANLTSIDSFYTGNVRFFDNSLQTSAYTASFANITIASSTATGTKGNICYDTNYIYMCVAANTWIRSSRVAW